MSFCDIKRCYSGGNTSSLAKNIGKTMPYKNLNDLPEKVRDNLPKHAQEIYKESFNSAWEHTNILKIVVTIKVAKNSS